MKISTRKFGEVDIDESKILVMPEGLPGFPGFEKFVLLEDQKTAPFAWFQSIEEPGLALIVMNPFLFKPDYELNLDGFIKSRNWKGISSEELVIYVVVNISEKQKGKRITANLIGPLIINPKNNEVIQVAVSDTDYSHQHIIVDP